MTTNPTSQLPPARMAGPDWAQITRQLRQAEVGAPGTDVMLRPGGQPELIDPYGQATQLSRLPAERMAAINQAPHSSDIGDLSRLDPDNVEQWTPTTAGLLNGWKFRLRPESGAPEYVFFAFRNPQDSNNFRVFVIEPNMDDQFGHGPHMIATVVGVDRIPVICGPTGRAAATLEEARLHAAKWMYHHYMRAHGHNPGFSL
ncbi:hypothetical protein [Nocardia sp. NPDC050412]|uniref:hypothetical protein n=1 Tax=Nocardia sp. NPDC050412 TaxID=3364320 RepID=UPI0037993F67